jgi:hypothetical protein
VVTVPTNAGGTVVVGALVVVIAGAVDADVETDGVDARVTACDVGRGPRADDEPSHAVVAHAATMIPVMSNARRHTFGVR